MKKFFDKISNQFISIDIYGSKPQLKIKKLDSFQTNFGSFLTLLSLFLTFFALGYFSIQLFDVSNPKLVISIRNIFNPPKILLNKTNYGFAFGLQNPITYDQFKDQSIYRAEAYHMTGRRIDGIFNWTQTQLDLDDCSISKYPKEFKNIFKDLPFKNLFCLKNTDFSLSGTFLNEEYEYIILKLYECKNTTIKDSVICKSKEYIDEILAGAFFLLSHTDLTIDPSNYTNPNQIYAGDSYTTISNRFFREMHHYLKIIKFETDKGWFISDIEDKLYLEMDYIKEITDFRKADNFLSYTIKLSTKQETYKRSYPKVQNVAAESGGILKMISLVSLILCYFYNKSKYYELIAEESMSEKLNVDPENNFKKNDFYKSSKMNELEQIVKNESNIGLNFKKLNFLNDNLKNNKKNIEEKFNFSSERMEISKKPLIKNKIISNHNIIDENLNFDQNKKNVNFSKIKNPAKNNIKFSSEKHLIQMNEDNQRILNINILSSNNDKKKFVHRLKLRMSFCQSFSYLLCLNSSTSKNKKYNRLYHIKRKTDELLDIFTLFKNFTDLDRLKKMIFDKEYLLKFDLPYYMEINFEKINQKKDIFLKLIENTKKNFE